MMEFFKAKKLPYWLTLGATVCGIVAFITYLAGGKTQFDPDYSVRAIVGGALGIAAGLISIVITLRPVVFAEYLFFLFSTICYITSQMNLIGNLIYNVDGSTAPAALIVYTVFSALSVIAALAAGIMMGSKKKKSAAGAAKEA